MLKKLCVLAIILGLSACASNTPLKQTAVEDMRANDVAVAFAYPEKKINYDELVYKVLWNEMRSATASFEGIWDIDRDFSQQFSQQFQEEGLHTVAINDILDDNEYAKFTDMMTTYVPNAQQGAKFSVDEKLRTSLLDKGIEYLIAMRGINIHVQASSGFGLNPRVTLAYRMNVVDLRKNSVEYSNVFFLGAVPDVDKSAREIEDNGLAKLRTELAKSIKTSFEKGMVTKQLGMVAAAQ